MNELSKC